VTLRRLQIPLKVGLFATTFLLVCGCSQAPVQHSAIGATAEQAVGVQFVTPVLPAGAAYISPARALAVATKSGGPSWSRPSSIKVQLGNFSDINAPGLATRTPAYLVTFSAISINFARGLAPATNTEWVVVINARTGHRIESFSYK
jgi:hypothetical protein